jgi:hypothetical protein
MVAKGAWEKAGSVRQVGTGSAGQGRHSLIAKQMVNHLAERLFTESMFSASKQAMASW